MEQKDYTKEVPINYYYLILAPGDPERRQKCLKTMKKFSSQNFYYLTESENIIKFQPVVKGEEYRLEMQLVLDKNLMVM